MFNHTTTRIPHSSTCSCSSQRPSSADISETESGTYHRSAGVKTTRKNSEYKKTEKSFFGKRYLDPRGASRLLVVHIHILFEKLGPCQNEGWKMGLKKGCCQLFTAYSLCSAPPAACWAPASAHWATDNKYFLSWFDFFLSNIFPANCQCLPDRGGIFVYPESCQAVSFFWHPSVNLP